MVLQSAQLSLLLVVLMHVSTTASVEKKCDTCKGIATKFKEGIENTAKSNFGGGNTNWEERKLGTYAFSETRLLEILDQSCADNKECHYMLEENEDVIEEWWFQHYAKTKEYNLLEYFCIDTIKVCCRDGFYGKDCSSCPGEKDRPCTGNGICQGSGTREGTGDCSCNHGYTGDLCADCAQNFFEQTRNDTHTVCIACHRACNSTCRGENVEDCDDCKEGWKQEESGHGCSDINECEKDDVGETKLCAETQICVNNEGSYACKECDRACASCTGEGPDHCVACSARFFNDEQVCRSCHKSCSSSCSDNTPNTCDECTSGWLKDDDLQACKDIDECSDGTASCQDDQFCENTEGYYLCKACHKTCSGCSGPGPTDCAACSSGYKMNEQNECADIDECVVEEEEVDAPRSVACPGVGEKCVNTIGSFKCECLSEYTFVRGKCQLKNKAVKKKKKESVTKESNMKPPTVIKPPGMPDLSPKFQGQLDESIEGFQKMVKELNQGEAKPIKGDPINHGDQVRMEGILKDGGVQDTMLPKTNDNDQAEKRTDFIKDDL